MVVYPFLRGCLLFFALLSLSCATGKGRSPYAPVYITPRAVYTPLPPGDIESPLDMAQHITGAWDGREFILDAWTEADENRVVMVFFSTLGNGLGDLSFDQGGLSFSSPLLPPTVQAEYILADFQFCFYRVEALEPALKRAGLTLRVEQPAGGRPEVRLILEGDRPLIRIEKDAARVVYTNYFRGYSYTLEGEW